MKIRLKKSKSPTVPTVERKTSITSKKKVIKLEDEKINRKSSERLLPFSFRKFFFNTGSTVR